VADVRVVVSKVFDGGFELWVPENGHRYEVGEEEPVAMKEAEEVWFQSGGPAQSGVANVIIDAPKEIPVTPGGVSWGRPVWPAKSASHRSETSPAETLDWRLEARVLPAAGTMKQPRKSPGFGLPLRRSRTNKGR
jgi:hypothetical protein